MNLIQKSKKYLIIIVLFTIWIVGSALNLWNHYILPTPKEVMLSAITLIKSGDLFKHIAISTLRVFEGFFITVLLAVPLGVLFGVNKNVYSYFEGLLGFLRHTPPLSLVPLLILWFGIGERSKVIIIILASFFPVLLNTISGVESCNKKLIEVGQTFNLSKINIFKKIVIPWALPSILVGMRLGIGYSWRAIIGAEMIAASSGLGYLILDGEQLSRSSVVIVGILCIGILGYLCDYIFLTLTKKFNYTQEENKK
ncbi:ABC transporter permease [Clostridium sp. cel8]|jgi:sulfonate transport system permease protein|uniref:ABC transporter permease n=1 Tax=unclassified Clostridium TaxID=2614128 RepID=UPI0015F64586|nr:ABC transporter permease [Clostridium sp. cel8]MBA5851528.1 ABC transporter permease [Clostridium sp. cel8]